ncbi:MAG TPA: DinB family protein [Anaerolineae bacterium]|nr:DinB family protein [Anaerolineae bacterium]
MKIGEIHTLFDYNYWANQRILTTCAKVTHDQYLASGTFPYISLRGTLIHILDAEQIWRVRCQQAAEASEITELEFPTLSALVALWRKEESAMRTYLASLIDSDLATFVGYKAGNGEPRSRVLWHILIHILIHGSQHRSEAAAILTSFKQSPGDIDFTMYLNTKSL